MPFPAGFGAADAAALAGIACLVAWPVFRDRVAILALQAGVGVFFALHFALIGLPGAAAIAALGAVQAAAAIGAPAVPLPDRPGWALIPAMAGAALWLGEGAETIVAALAMALIAMGRMQADVLRLPLLILGGTGAWLAHDALVGAWLMVAGDVLSAAVGLWALLAPSVRLWLAGARARPA